MKKLIFLSLLGLFAINIFAQPTFEKLYSDCDAVINLDNHFFAVKKDSKWGVMKNKTQVLDFYYDSIDVLSDGIITYIKNNQVGFADTLGNVITLALYDMETPFVRVNESVLNMFYDGSALVYNGNKLILLGKDGKQINDDSYEIISKENNVVVFKKDGAYGLMDAKGNIVAANKYRRIQDVIPSELYAYTYNTNGMDYLGLISKDGKVLSKAEYEDMTIINKNDKYYIKAFVSTGKQALFDTQGNLLFRPLYQNVEPINSDNYFVFTDNTRKGIIGRDYITYIPAFYDDIRIVNVDKDTFFVAKNDNKTYILSENNKVLDEIEGNIKDFISYKNNELLYIADSMLNYGVRSDKKGWLINPKYLDIFAEINNTFVVRQKDKWGLIDMNDNIVIPFEYNKVRASQNKTCVVFYDGKKNSILVLDNGKQMEFAKSNNVLPMNNYVEYKFKGDNIRLYFDGREIKNKFKAIGSEKDGILTVKTKKGWAYVDSDTYENLTEQYFDFAIGFNDNAAYVVKNKKLYQIDKHFNIIATILDENYEDLNNTASFLNVCTVLKKNHVILQDKKGKYTVFKIVY